MESCNGCDAVDAVNSNGYCVPCQIEQYKANEGLDVEVCIFCGRDKDDLHTGDCILALALDFADGDTRPEYEDDAKAAYGRLHTAGVL